MRHAFQATLVNRYEIHVAVTGRIKFAVRGGCGVCPLRNEGAIVDKAGAYHNAREYHQLKA